MWWGTQRVTRRSLLDPAAGEADFSPTFQPSLPEIGRRAARLEPAQAPRPLGRAGGLQEQAGSDTKLHHQQQPGLEQCAWTCGCKGLSAAPCPRCGGPSVVGPLLLASGTRTPSTWSRGYSRRLRAGVSPSKLFWLVGWLQKGKTRRGFCREQPGGRACLLFN